MLDAYTIMMALAFVCIFIVVHIMFKNIRQICFWSCKIITTLYLWMCLWVITHLDSLPLWKTSFTDSVWELYNMTAEKYSL